MKIKRMVKRLFAVGAGAVMLGATITGAMAAADLKDYPNMFVTDGTFNGLMVVGEHAAAVDNLAMTDIASSMKYAKASSASTTTVKGDAWQVATSSKKLEISNNNATGTNLRGETFRDINTFIGVDELKALENGNWNTNARTFGYQQFLFFDADADATANAISRIVKYVENPDNSVSTDHLFIRSNRQIARYRLEFSSTAQSDVTDSSGAADTTGTYLDDFRNTHIKMLGKDYTVVLAQRPSGVAGGQNIKLTLMGGAASDTVLEGETKTYSVSGKSYDVSLTFIDSDECKFAVNGEATNKLKVGDTYVLADKSEVGVSEVLYQDYAGGIHSCTFFVGAEKLEMQDDSVTTPTSTNRLRVGSTDIDGANVIITGTNDNTTFTVSTIDLNITADGDYYVAANGKLSEAITASGDNNKNLFNGGIDIEYKGLTEEPTRDIQIKTNSVRRYQLRGLDGDGKEIDIPVAYAVGTGNVTIGEEVYTGARTNDKRLLIVEGADIFKDDFFVVTGGTASDGSAKSYLLQYKGADRQTKSSPKIKFKNTGSGETLEYSVSTIDAGTTATVATIKVGGNSFLVQNATSVQADDFRVDVDLDGGGAIGTNLITFVDGYGAQWAFAANITNYDADAAGTSVGGTNVGTGNNGTTGGNSWISLTMTTPNADNYDNQIPSTVIWNVTSTSDPELRGTLSGGLSLVTPEGKTNVAYGYDTMGRYITYSTPSGDPQELTLASSKKQRFPQVYITSGATTSSTAAGGDLTAVSIVDATKLDNEVASVTAQNLIVVGGPCVNTVAAELLGNPATCAAGFTPGKARVKLFEHANGKVAMLVAGYTGQDTRLAGKVLAHRGSEMSGMEVEVEGTTYSDATIAAPSVAASAASTQ